MLFLSLFFSLFFLPSAVFAAWGWTDNGSEYVIDSGSDLVIKVTKCCGDISSLNYKGVEYNGWGGKNSHVESGLGTSTVSITSYSNVIKVSVVHGTLKHWIFVRYGNNNVYLFTNKADDSVSAMRYIVRIKVCDGSRMFVGSLNSTEMTGRNLQPCLDRERLLRCR